MAFTIYPFIIGTSWKKNQPILMNHEKIHLKQEKELLIIPFLIVHVLSFFLILIRRLSIVKAYKTSVFEREAFAHEENLEYLNTRKLFAWIRKDTLIKTYCETILAQKTPIGERLGALMLLFVTFGMFFGILAPLFFE